MTEIVSAVVVRRSPDQARVLLVQRAADCEMGFAWECPSAHLRPSEPHHAAVRRTIGEPACLDVRWVDGEPLAVIEDSDGNVRFLYAATLMPGSTLGISSGFGWFTWDELVRLTLAHRGKSLLVIKRRLDAA